ncbi:MAG: hypothetical protein GPJ51_15690 [Candidatus Heimdallarchaeota archaeon]|nr:hypothetical protein [Candidatus Heimdallarchaeota archaeon]
MASSPGELWIKLAQMGIISLILGYFMYRRYRDKITGFTWFIWLFGLVILQGIFEIIIFILWYVYGYLEYTDIVNASSLFEIHMIPSAIALFVLFLYLEFMRHEKPNTFLLATASTLLGSYLIVLILELVFKLEYGLIEPEYRVSRIILNIFQAFVLGEAFYVYIQDTIRAEYKKLKRISFIIATATGIGFIAAFLKVFERWTQNFFQVYGAIPFSLTFGILALAFIFNPFYVYLLPAKINKILIFNDAGLLLYSVSIGAKESEKAYQDILVTGTITALKLLISETTGAKTDLRKVSFRDKKLIVVENKDKNITTLIIGDSDAWILQTAAKHFTENFCEMFKSAISRFDGNVAQFEKANDIVRQVFPFVPPEEIVRDRV